MGFLDMFDNPDILTTLLGGTPGAPPIAPAPPQMKGGMMGEVLDRAPPAPMETNTGLNVPDQLPPTTQPAGGGGPRIGNTPITEENTGLFKHDQLPPGQPAGPTMAGVGFPPSPAGSATAATDLRRPVRLAPLPGPVGGAAGPTGPGAIPTGVGPIQPPGDPLNIQPALPPPPSAFAGGPPTSTLGSLAAALGLTKEQRVGNAITAGLSGLGKGLTAVGQARPGASGAQMAALGAGGGLTGGMEELDRQQKQRMAERKQFFDETISSNNEWLKNKIFPYNIMHLQASTNYLNGYGRNGAGSRDPWQISDIGRLHLAQTDAKAQYQQELQELNLRRQAGEDIPEKELKGLRGRKDQILKEQYEKYKVNPDSAQGTAKNPIDVTKGGPRGGPMTEQQLETMPHGTVYSWKDKDGNTVTGTRDWSTRPPQQQQQQQTPDYAATQAALGAGAGQTSQQAMY